MRAAQYPDPGRRSIDGAVPERCSAGLHGTIVVRAATRRITMQGHHEWTRSHRSTGHSRPHLQRPQRPNALARVSRIVVTCAMALALVLNGLPGAAPTLAHAA